MRLPLYFLFFLLCSVLSAQINPNGGFENAPVGECTGSDITGYSMLLGGTADAVFEIVADSEFVHSGNQALKVTVNALGSNTWEPQVTNQEFAILPDTTYVVSVWAKADIDSAKADFSMNALSPNWYEWGRAHNFILTTEWQEVKFEIKTRPDEAEPRAGIPIHFGVVSNADLLPITVYLDDISVLPKGVVNPNGFFEDAIPGEHINSEVPHWVLYNGGTSDAVFEIVTDSSEVHSGMQALKITVNAVGANAWEPQVYNEEFPVTSNQYFRVSAWAKADVEGFLTHFTIGSLSPNYYEWGRAHNVALGLDWQQVVFEVTTRDPEAEPRGGVPIHFGSADNSTLLPVTIWLDDVEVVTMTNPVGVNDPEAIAASYSLQQNYPNPFNPATTISFSIPERSDIRLVLMDILGKEVSEIASGSYDAGTHQVNLNASNLTSGVYFYRLQAGSFTSTKKLMLMK